MGSRVRKAPGFVNNESHLLNHGEKKEWIKGNAAHFTAGP